MGGGGGVGLAPYWLPVATGAARVSTLLLYCIMDVCMELLLLPTDLNLLMKLCKLQRWSNKVSVV